MKKQTLYGIIGVVVITLACSFGSETPAAPTQQVDEVGTVVAATMQALLTATGEDSPTQIPTQSSGTPVSFEYASFVIPDGLASGADPESVAAVSEEDNAPWDLAPAHLKFILTGYQLQDKFHEPGIFVYPADEFAQLNSNAAEQIGRVKSILSGLAPTKETLPHVPFFNAAPLIGATIQIVPFQNGRGVRSLTQYSQFAGQINNRDLFYHFQGLTDDGKYHVIVVLPITAPILPATHDVSLPVPEGGVPFPEENLGPNSPYYVSVTEKLNALSPDDYAPSLNTLDALVQSILVTTP